MKYFLTVFLLFVVACTEVAPESYDVYGESSDPSAAIAIEAVVADSPVYTNQMVSVSGTVHAVCQMDGCWLTLQGIDGESVRVDVARTTDGDYAFTVPADISGRRAIARGMLEVDDIDAATQQHYNSDAGMDLVPSSFSMVASGVMIVSQ